MTTLGVEDNEHANRSVNTMPETIRFSDSLFIRLRIVWIRK
jgi:hypothetical protein